MTRLRVLSLASLAALATALLGAPPPDLARQVEEQRQIRAETEKLVRRVETLIRVLEYNRVGGSGQKALLDEARKSLAGVGRGQMAALLAALEKAAQERGAGRSAELKKAAGYHEEVVLELKGVLACFDAVRDLTHAAGRLEKMARHQAEQSLATSQAVSESEGVPAGKPNPVLASIGRTVSEQVFLRKDFATLLGQVSALKETLPAEQQKLAAKFAEAAAAQRLGSAFDDALRALRQTGPPEARLRDWRRAASLQWDLAGRLVSLARLLRGPGEPAAVLREARRRLAKEIDEQQALRGDTRSPPKLEGGDLTRARPAVVRGKAMGDRQGFLEFDTHLTRGLLAPHWPELAAKLGPAETSMREAQEALRRQRRPELATHVQGQALEALRGVRKEVDRLLAEEEKAVGAVDPAAAAQQVAKALEQARAAQTASAQAAKGPPDAAAQLAKSRAATEGAMAAAGQAQAQAPRGVRGQLGEAGRRLATAAEALRQGDPSGAGEAQGEAAGALARALATLEQAAATAPGRG
jgi:hypothetical protein